MRYESKVERYVGWQLSGDLIGSPYERNREDAAQNLSAVFRYVVLQNGQEVYQASAIQTPEMIALTETELRDTTFGSRAAIMGISRSLREAALAKFPPLVAEKAFAPAPVAEPETEAQPARLLVVYYREEPARQMAAAIPPRYNDLQMGG